MLPLFIDRCIKKDYFTDRAPGYRSNSKGFVTWGVTNGTFELPLNRVEKILGFRIESIKDSSLLRVRNSLVCISVNRQRKSVRVLTTQNVNEFTFNVLCRDLLAKEG